MVIDVDDLDHSFSTINKNRPIGSSDSEAIQMQVFWLEDLCSKTGMEGIFKKKIELFLENLLKLMFLQVCDQPFRKWQSLHNH